MSEWIGLNNPNPKAFKGWPVTKRQYLEKVQVARSAGAILALEDDPQAVKGYTDSGITVLMPDWPYNRDVHNPTVVRLKGVVELGYCNA